LKKYLIVFLLITFVAKLHAQNLQGKVIDEVSGLGIPFASVAVLGTSNVTITNENGDFVLKLPLFPAKIRCSHVSYLLSEISLNNNPAAVLEFKLKPASISLNEVTVDPYKGLRIIKAALELAQKFENQNFYANAFYRQLTTLNGNPSQIYELFFDLEFNVKRIQGWVAKESRFAETTDDIAFSLNNQSYLTFSYAGYLFPNSGGKYITLKNLSDYQIEVEKYIDQTEQKIAVVTCKYKSAKRNQYYINSTYYIGIDDHKIYRVENSVFNLPIKFTEATAKIPPILTTVATFNGTKQSIPILESISTKLFLSLNVKGRELNSHINSLLTVYEVNDKIKNQQFSTLNKNTKDKTVIESIVYNADFWKDNPIVKQTTLEDSFIKMMESKSAFGTMINQ
jgi:hypothetical protein